jgi:two-component system phosphate regulon response regulator PhoB
MAYLVHNDFHPSVLVVENEENTLKMLSYNLRRHGFIVYTATSGKQALAVAQEKKPSMIIVTQQLAGEQGVDLCKELRQHPLTLDMPLILLVPQGEAVEELARAQGGADEYIPVPIVPAELITRVKATYRRLRPRHVTRVLEFDDVTMNLASYQVTKGGKRVRLGPTEFKILQCLMEFPKRTLSRENIIAYVWGDSSNIEARTIDVHINRLRTALRGNNEEPPLIETIRSAGYCLRREGGLAYQRKARKVAE